LLLRHFYREEKRVLKAVLFDMDGVLVDSDPVYVKLEKKIGKTLGLDLGDRELGEYVGIRPLEMWRDLKRKYGFDADPAQLAGREAVLMDEYYASGTLYPIVPTIAFLKQCAAAGLKIAVATSSERVNADIVAARIGIASHVQAVASSCMAGKSKPAPDIFLLAAKLLCTRPGECVVIEDAYSGVLAAVAAGMKVVGLRSAAHAQDMSKADMVVDSCAQLSVDVLRGLIVEDNG